jgi:hypothetical protein
VSQRKQWSRGDKWAAIGVLVVVIFGVGAYFVPEIRKTLGLDKSAPAAQMPGQQNTVQQNTTGAGSVAVNGDGNRVTTNVTSGGKK